MTEAKIRAGFNWLETALVRVAIGATLLMLVILFAQVVMRYVFKLPLSWSEEIAMLLFAWVIVLSTVVGVRRNSHARMNILSDAFPASVQVWWERGVSLIPFGVGLYMAYAGWDYLAETRGATSAATAYPIELLHAAAPAFGLLLALFAIERMIFGVEVKND